MPNIYRALPGVVPALLLVPLLAAAQIRCSAALSAVDKLICSDADLLQLDLQLGNAYGALRGVTNDKNNLAQEQRKWLASLRGSCESRDCLAKVYSARTEALSSQLLNEVAVRTEPLSSAEAMNACIELATLADDKHLSKHALWGRSQWNAERQDDQTAWMLSTAELANLKARDSYQTSSGPQLVYRVRLNNRDAPTRFASFETGGTCRSTQVFNVSHLLSSTGDDAGTDEVSDPDEQIRWAYWGGGDYPVQYHGRNYMITSALGDPNSVNMISWIKSDGRIRPLCLLGSTDRRRIPLPVHKAPLCQAIANGALRPLTWRPIADELPINHEPAVYRHEFERSYGRYADGVGLLQIDLNGDGLAENVARFEYNSGAGCGSTHVWMSVVSKDLRNVAQDPLTKLLEQIDEGSMDIYQHKGRYYVDTSTGVGNSALISLQGNQIERVCAFEWKLKSIVSKFFPLEQ